MTEGRVCTTARDGPDLVPAPGEPLVGAPSVAHGCPDRFCPLIEDLRAGDCGDRDGHQGVELLLVAFLHLLEHVDGVRRDRRVTRRPTGSDALLPLGVTHAGLQPTCLGRPVGLRAQDRHRTGAWLLGVPARAQVAALLLREALDHVLLACADVVHPVLEETGRRGKSDSFSSIGQGWCCWRRSSRHQRCCPGIRRCSPNARCCSKRVLRQAPKPRPVIGGRVAGPSVAAHRCFWSVHQCLNLGLAVRGLDLAGL
mmetsp:Transcript_9973/g.31677  ORF Transcript_9973/g.31677 Transcript_9973/m.31677 type:complete len:255 (+) Transcript_9973:1287-2051(+)